MLSQSADKVTVTANWSKTATDLTSTRWDVTSDRPGFGHKFVDEPTHTVSWKTDANNCNTGWRYTVTGYNSAGQQVGQPVSTLFMPACPATPDNPTRVQLVAPTPLPVAVQGTVPVTVPTPVPVREVAPGTANFVCDVDCQVQATLVPEQWQRLEYVAALLIFFGSSAAVIGWRRRG